MIKTQTIDSYRFGFTMNLIEAQLRTLADYFHPAESADVPILGGRTAVTPVKLDHIGSVIIKHYRRGGLLRHFIKRRYLRLGKTRARREFELLAAVSSMGINVPEPIAYCDCGRIFYRAWLVTREIHQPLSLAGLIANNNKKAVTAMTSVIEQTATLIQNGILHVDLHPGNVVVDATGKVYLLDFDKAHVFHANRQKLKNRYIARWQRAVDKHGLPEILNEIFRSGLERA